MTSNIRRQTIGSTPINVERQNPIRHIIGKKRYMKTTSAILHSNFLTISTELKIRQTRNRPVVRRSKYAPVRACGVRIIKYPPTKAKINTKFMKARKKYSRSDGLARCLVHS
jgi:hypothetical protein